MYWPYRAASYALPLMYASMGESIFLANTIWASEATNCSSVAPAARAGVGSSDSPNPSPNPSPRLSLRDEGNRDVLGEAGTEGVEVMARGDIRRVG